MTTCNCGDDQRPGYLHIAGTGCLPNTTVAELCRRQQRIDNHRGGDEDRFNRNPTAAQWVAWFRESAAQADDLTEGERDGFRVAADHLDDTRIQRLAASISTEESGDRPNPHTEAAISGDPPQPTRETDLLRAGESLARIARDLGDNAHRYALQDLIDYLTGRLGAPGSSWPVRLPVPDHEATP